MDIQIMKDSLGDNTENYKNGLIGRRNERDIFDDMLDDTDVRKMMVLISNAREEGVDWDTIYENIEDYEKKAGTELGTYRDERGILIKAMKAGEQAE